MKRKRRKRPERNRGHVIRSALAVVQALLKGGPCSAPELAERAGIGKRTLYRILAELARAGLELQVRPGMYSVSRAAVVRWLTEWREI